MLVTSRPKLKKYFHPEKVEELISLFNIVAEKVKLKKIESICRDPKDDFLLAMAKESKADYLITGDKDLLEIKDYRNTKILTATNFKYKFFR
jgi:putative PIN family toxin of toxin-antitoxin system